MPLTTPLASCMRRSATGPLYLPFVLLGAVWTFLYRDNPSRHVLGEVLVIAVFYVLFTQSLPNLARRGCCR